MTTIAVADLFGKSKPAGKIKLRILRMIRSPRTGHQPGYQWVIDFHAQHSGKSEFSYLIYETEDPEIPSAEVIADIAIRENPCVDRDTLIRFIELYYNQQKRGGSSEIRLTP